MSSPCDANATSEDRLPEPDGEEEDSLPMTNMATFQHADLERVIAGGVRLLRRSCEVDIALGGAYDRANPATRAIRTLEGTVGRSLYLLPGTSAP